MMTMSEKRHLSVSCWLWLWPTLSSSRPSIFGYRLRVNCLESTLSDQTPKARWSAHGTFRDLSRQQQCLSLVPQGRRSGDHCDKTRVPNEGQLSRRDRTAQGSGSECNHL